MRENFKNLDFIIADKLKKGEAYYISIEDLSGIGRFCFEIVLIDEIQKTNIQEDVCIYNEIEYLGEVKQYEFCASEDGVYLIDVDSLANVDIVKRDENGNAIENMNLKKGEKRIIEVSGENSPFTIASYGLKVYNFTSKLKNAKEIWCDKEYEGNIIEGNLEILFNNKWLKISYYIDTKSIIYINFQNPKKMTDEIIMTIPINSIFKNTILSKNSNKMKSNKGRYACKWNY